MAGRAGRGILEGKSSPDGRVIREGDPRENRGLGRNVSTMVARSQIHPIEPTEQTITQWLCAVTRVVAVDS